MPQRDQLPVLPVSTSSFPVRESMVVARAPVASAPIPPQQLRPIQPQMQWLHLCLLQCSKPVAQHNQVPPPKLLLLEQEKSRTSQRAILPEQNA